jgi:hypothetical protein
VQSTSRVHFGIALVHREWVTTILGKLLEELNARFHMEKIQLWMTTNRPKLNPSNADMIAIHSQRQARIFIPGNSVYPM